MWKKLQRMTENIIWFDFWYFNATFNNISAISWRPALVLNQFLRESRNKIIWRNYIYFCIYCWKFHENQIRGQTKYYKKKLVFTDSTKHTELRSKWYDIIHSRAKSISPLSYFPIYFIYSKYQFFFIIFGLTWPRLEPTIKHTRDEQLTITLPIRLNIDDDGQSLTEKTVVKLYLDDMYNDDDDDVLFALCNMLICIKWNNSPRVVFCLTP
jgi:hypothetical protein